MTVFLCCLAAGALLGFNSYNIKSTTAPWVLVALQSLDVLLTLGLAALALWSYQR